MNPKWAQDAATKAQVKILRFFLYELTGAETRLEAAQEIDSIVQERAFCALLEAYEKVTGDNDPLNYELLPFDYGDLMPFRWSSWDDLVHNYNLFNPKPPSLGDFDEDSDFVPIWVRKALIAERIHEEGICYYEGKITFDGSIFVFTGGFNYGSKKSCKAALVAKKGAIASHVSTRVDYLVLGGKGSRFYKEGGFGNKVIDAVALQSVGHRIKIVTEDHWSKALKLS
jgi:NAD-dependent DNA ligase